MIIQQIKLENIRSYISETIDFPLGSVLLAGDIGSGKSTILLAAEFALFGIMKGDVGGLQLLRHGAREGSVQLAIEVGGKEVIIKRSLKRGSAGISQESGYIIIGGVKTELVAKELKARILKLLGYSESLLNKSKSLIYRYTVYTPQEDMKRIILSGPQERLDTLRSVFGIDKYKTIRENTATLVRELKRKISFAEGQIMDLDKLKKEIEERKSQRKIVKDEEEKILPILHKAKEEVKEKTEALSKKEAEVERLKQEKSGLKIIEEKISASEKNIKEYQSRIASGSEKLKKLEEEVLGERKISEEKLKDKLTAIKLEISKHREKISMVTRKIGQFDFLKAESEKTAEKIASLRTCPLCLQKVEEDHKHNISVETKRKVADAEKSLKALLAEKEEAEKKLILSDKKLEELEDAGKKAGLQRLKLKLIDEKREEEAELKKTLKEEEDKYKWLTGEKKISLEKIKSSKDVDEEYHELKKILLKCQSEEKDASIKLARIVQQKKSMDEVLSGLQKRIDEKEELKVKLSKMKEVSFWLSNHFEELMASMEKHVFASVYHEFNSLVAKWFSMLMGDEGITIRLDTEFSPTLEQNGYETEIENLSGGEKTAVALAYRLALNKVINNLVSGIRTKDIIILDEPTDGFSSEQLDRVHDVISELGLKQIMIVSHEPKIEGFVDKVIRVIKEDHKSMILG